MYMPYTYSMYNVKETNEQVLESYEGSYQYVIYQAYWNLPTIMIDFVQR